MGYTSFTIGKIEPLLINVKSIVDLGAQNNYAQPNLPAPYISQWYDNKHILYECIDLSGENRALAADLSELLFVSTETFDLVVDAGTSEHVGKGGAFSWEAIYNCWLNKHNLLKIGGLMYNENPETGNWPGHGFNYHTIKFYYQLAELTDYKILDLGEHPAMGNTTDGWNVFSILKKKSEKFPTLEEFIKMDIRKS